MNTSSEHQKLIEKFYTAFLKKDFRAMTECYHTDIEFEDPVFGKLKGKDASKMWEMLLTRSKDLTVTFSNATANGQKGSVNWVAHYTFTRTGNKVINNIQASFEFKEGKIHKHKDSFNLTTWFVSAFGWKGYLFIALPFLRKKFQERARQMVRRFNV
jgi:ketosteroid isomerase-like protein